MPRRKIKVKTSYNIVTDESAKEGDYAEQGWENEEGEEFDTVADVIDFLKDKGVVEASSMPCFQIGVWYVGRQDLYTGGYRTENYHLKNATPQQQERIYNALFDKEKHRCVTELTRKMQERER